MRPLLIYPELSATFRERDIHSGGVIRDGEGSGQGDEEGKKRDIIGRRFVIMKSLIAVLMGVAVLSVISSCGTVTTGPEGSSILIGNK